MNHPIKTQWMKFQRKCRAVRVHGRMRKAYRVLGTREYRTNEWYKARFFRVVELLRRGTSDKLYYVQYEERLKIRY